jgi:hypothetical protein
MFVKLVFSILIIVLINGCSHQPAPSINTLPPDENIFVGRIHYIDDANLTKNKSFLQKMGIEKWRLESYKLCFNDGQDICRNFKTSSTNISKHENNATGLIAFNSRAKTIKIKSIEFIADNTSFQYDFITSPQIQIDNTEQVYYIGDFLVYLDGSDETDDTIPKLNMISSYKIRDTGKIYAKSSKLNGRVKIIPLLFNLREGITVKGLRTNTIHHHAYIPIIKVD